MPVIGEGLVIPFTVGEEEESPGVPTPPPSRAVWDFQLCDGHGNALADLTTATGKQVVRRRNYYTEIQCILSHEDEAAKALLAAVKSGPWPTLKAYRKSPNQPSGTLRFNGWLAPFTETLSEEGRLSLVFRSPFWRMYGDGSTTGRFTSQITAEEKIADQIAASLVKLCGAGKNGEVDPSFNETVYGSPFGIGLGLGRFASTVSRFVTYKYANMGQAIVYLSQMLGGFDFYESFVENGLSDEHGTPLLALFNTIAAQGEVRPNALFQYGPDTLANVIAVERTTAPPNNAVRLLGGNGAVSDFPISEAQVPASSYATFGGWPAQETAQGQPTLEALEKRAVALGRPNPIKTLTITPDFSVPNCPQVYDDFDLGDTISFYAKRGAFEENLQARVNEMSIVIDDEGNETTAIPNPQSLVPNDETDMLHTVFTLETGNGN